MVIKKEININKKVKDDYNKGKIKFRIKPWFS